MDAIELLAREDEFKRLNKQLEKKTESLMKEIEHEMNKQDIFSEFQPCLSLNIPSKHSIKKHCCTPIPSNNTTPEKTVRTLPKSSYTKSVSPANRSEQVTPKSLVTNEIKNKVICDFCAEARNNRIESNSNDLEFLYAFVEVNIKDGTLPTSFSKDRVTVENVCKFLSSKIKLMQEQMERLQNTINKKASQCESHMTQLAELESERMSLLNKTNNMKSSTADMRAKYMAAQRRFEDKERLYKEQRSETDKLSSELKRIKLKNCNLEARCASQEQIIDSLKQQLDICKKSEKEFRDSTRALSNSHQATITKLESQIKYQNNRLKKQNSLIENLRHQNLLYNVDVGIKNIEKQYMELLNQDI